MNNDYLKEAVYYCQFCSKYCHNRNSLRQHEIRCKHNPSKINTMTSGFNCNRSYEAGTPAWNKGLTKDTDSRILAHAQAVSETMRGRIGRKQSPETKAKLSSIAKERELGGFNMRNKGILYNDTKLDSSYEVEVAKSLDANNVRWIRPKRIKYITPSGCSHYYTSDFYLPDYDIYLDPKNDFLIENINPSTGYKDTDKITWVMQQHSIKILILNKDQLTWDVIKTLF